MEIYQFSATKEFDHNNPSVYFVHFKSKDRKLLTLTRTHLQANRPQDIKIPLPETLVWVEAVEVREL